MLYQRSRWDDPPPPESFVPCFVDAWNAVELPPPDAEVRVEVRFGGSRGRRPRGPG